jgi:hypothetical protein
MLWAWGIFWGEVLFHLLYFLHYFLVDMPFKLSPRFSLVPALQLHRSHDITISSLLPTTVQPAFDAFFLNKYLSVPKATIIKVLGYNHFKMSAPNANQASMVSGHAQYAKGYVEETSKGISKELLKFRMRLTLEQLATLRGQRNGRRAGRKMPERGSMR